ncbi:PCMD domain-containing protein [uncultured Mediterranea sp.]|uniref:PCMD domain-containing protein n=1 Tax=uncultured Mediterranea sp. TaxID=1926662 RepID=UPI0027D97CA2|nr:PCMD domain-containing protein [uncultured Mediterranea sp.]
MKVKQLLSCFLLAASLFSCIQDEALNVEAAIDACTGPDVQLASINPMNRTVDIYISRSTDLSKLELNFTLPEGATIQADEPLAQDAPPKYDFSSQAKRSFTVTAEDKEYTAVYEIAPIISELPTVYHFDELKNAAQTKYHTLMEFQYPSSGSDFRVMEWCSGNPGFDMTGEAKVAADYPTVQAPDGISRQCVKLETKSTGSFGAMVKMYIAAGNLFIGSFELESLAEAAKNTHFGYPFYQIPKELKGYYKYKRGAQFQVGKDIVTDRQDYCDIYGVMYESDDQVDFLDGTNSLTSPNIVLLARAEPSSYAETDEWTEFTLPFVAQNGKTIDEAKLKAGKYKLSIVFSSSVEGAIFNGAIGSTLYIDEVKLVCEP